jgi:hypothetical protein
MFSPLLIAPSVAVTTASALAFGPAYAKRSSVVLIVVAMSAAVFLPWLGEVLGWLPQTIDSSGAGIALTAPALLVSHGWKIFALIAAMVAAIASAAGMGNRMCASDRAARRALHLQTWQLRQLVPDAARAA